jgi:hypothetical protein
LPNQSASQAVSPFTVGFLVLLCRNEENVVPQVVDAVLHLPPTVHIAVRHTSLKLIGELREWIEKHPHYIGLPLTACCHIGYESYLVRSAYFLLESISNETCKLHFNETQQHWDPSKVVRSKSETYLGWCGCFNGAIDCIQLQHAF